MAITVIATAMSATANSYVTIADADSYHETRLHISDWSNASTADKNAAVVWATRLLDEHMNWLGYQTDTSGALRWPRKNVYDLDGNAFDNQVIPDWLENATAEFARHLIVSDRLLEDDTKGFKKLKVGTLELQPLASDRKTQIPPSVWSIIRHYGVKQSSGIRRLQRA